MRNPNRTLRIFLRHSLPLLVVSLVLGFGATLLSRNFIRQNSLKQATQTLNQVRSYYDVILDEMDSVSLMFSTNPEMLVRLQRILAEENTIDLDNYREIKLIKSFLSALANARPYIDSIHVYLENEQDLVLSSNLGFTPIPYLEDQSWLQTYRNLPTQRKTYSQRVVLREGTPTHFTIIRLLRPITSLTGSTIGVIVLDIKENSLSQGALSQEGEYLNVTNEQGSFLFSNPQKPSPYQDKEMQYFQSTSAKYGWKYSLAVHKPKLYELSSTLMTYTSALTLLALLLGLFLTHRTNRQERIFLDNVLKQLKGVAKSNISEEESSYRNIFDYLNHHVIKTFIEQDYLRWQKEAMEYRALQMQINPHFLFNTLDTINWKAVKLADGENDVSRMILLLSKLLKYSLQVDDPKGVPLSKELEMTDYYLQLQTIRFRDRFSYTEAVDPTLSDILVPSLLFQPIMENSFNHGFVEGKQLSIKLEAVREGEMAVIRISDNGKSLSEEQVACLNAMDVDALQKKESLGLCNIRKRLQLFTQEKSPMVVSSDENGRFTITLILPLRKG